MATEVKERSVPKPVFTDAEAGAQEFPSWQSRSFNYFTPRKRRATVYEDVTVDVQPDPERHLTQGWVYAFADGIAGYPQEWTALKSSNWHEFLDPNEEWEQTIYRNNANVVRQISQNIEHGRTAHVFQAMNRAWVKVLERHVFAWAHVEHGLGMHVYTPAQRDAPTNMINNAIAVGALHKLRFAQDLILYNLALSEEIDGFEGSLHKQTWQEDPIWQPTRELVERLTGIRDWCEAVFVDHGRVRAAGRRAVPLGLRDAGGRPAGRLRHADDHGRRRVRCRPRAAGRARAVPDAVRRRGPRRGEPRDHATVARGVDAAARSRRCGSSSPSGPRCPRRSCASRTPSSAPAGASRLCSATSASRPRRRSPHDAVRFRSHLVEHGRGDPDEQSGRLHRRRGDARQGQRHGHRAAVDDPRRRRRASSTSTTRRWPRRWAGTTSATTTSRR